MDLFVYLMVLSVLIAVIALIALFWNIKNGQYEDLEGASQRILVDEENQDDIAKSL